MTGPAVLVDARRLWYRPNGGHGPSGACWLRLYRTDGGHVAVVTELAANPSMSVTNAAESIYDTVARLAGPDRPLVLVEHYNDTISYGGSRWRTTPDRWQLVDVHLGRATWTPTSEAEVEAMIGGPLDPIPDYFNLRL